MAIRDHINSDFNAHSRQLECKIDIYFDEIPITITSNDYIMTINLLEELTAEEYNPFGAISANELDVILHNKADIFSPNNTNGPYYGKIKNGVKFVPYMRIVHKIDTLNWIKLGEYYSSDWKSTDSIASVYLTDIIKDVINSDDKEAQVISSVTFKSFIEQYLYMLGHVPYIDSSIEGTIPFAYANSNIGKTLTELMCAAKASFYSDREGNLVVKSLIKPRSVVATLTDNDQIINIENTQSMLKTYNGVHVTYAHAQLETNKLILNMEDMSIPNGTFMHGPIKYDAVVSDIASVALQTLNNIAMVTLFEYTSSSIKITTQSSSDLKSNLKVFGNVLTLVDKVLSDDTNNMFKYSNNYIQEANLASSFKAFLTALVTSQRPTLNLSIRGNLLLNIGDKIIVQSNRYNITFTGIIQRMDHEYKGSLRTTLTLLNSEILEVL